MAKYTDAQKEAAAHNSKKTYGRIDVFVPKSQREHIKAFAANWESPVFYIGSIKHR